eukprot:SAG31_NODE_25722_length_455_cov_2.171348_1_plen_62_part_10
MRAGAAAARAARARSSAQAMSQQPARAAGTAHRVYNKQYLNLVPESTGFEYRIQVPETKFRF